MIAFRCTSVLMILLLGACTGSRALPLVQLDGITRIEVRNPRGTTNAHVIVAPEQIQRAVAAVRSLDSGWEQPTTTLPAGDVAVLFYRDTVVVGVVWLGRDYIIARGTERPLIRSLGTEEWIRLAEALQLPQRVIEAPPLRTS
jgi:hypothetical protein